MAGSAGLVMCEREFISKILGGMIMMKKKSLMQRMKNSMMLSMNKELWSEKNS